MHSIHQSSTTRIVLSPAGVTSLCSSCSVHPPGGALPSQWTQYETAARAEELLGSMCFRWHEWHRRWPFRG